MALTLSIGITENSYSVANNTSSVTVSVNISWTGGSWDHNYYTKYVTINGSQYNFDSVKVNPNRTKTGSQTLYSTTVTIGHNSDGTGSVSCYSSVKTATGSGTVTASNSKTLTTIPRASATRLSASSVNMGSAVTVYTDRASSSFTHYFYYRIGSGSWNLVATGIGDSYTWTVPLSLASHVPSGTSLSVTVNIDTYSGSTKIGSTYNTLTCYVPSSVVPSVSGISVVDTNGYESTFGGYVQGKSVPKITVNASASYSSISQYKVSFQGNNYISTSNVITLGAISKTGSSNITVTVTDARGRTASSEVTITSLAYSSPSVSATVIRCDADGTANDDGAYMKITCKATITALNDINSKSVVLAYKRKSEVSWTTAKTWAAYSIDEAVIISADVNSSYDIKLTATDDFSGSNPAIFTTEIGTTEAIIDFKSDGKGMAIGKASERYGLEVEWNAQFNNDVNINEVNFKPSDSFKEHWAAILNGETPSGTNPLLDLIHPVGSIYWSTNITSPETLFGGTWEQIKDTFILAAGDSYSAGSTGGEAEHTLKTSEIPAHTHGSKSLVGYFNIRGCDSGGKTDTITYADGIMSKTYSTWSGSHQRLTTTANTNPNIYKITTDASHEHNSVGGSGAHNNMPPYLVAYCWKRTA